MARTARAAGLALRPHVKTHKIPQLARRQVEKGACGITVAKLGEAEVMAAAGIHDIFIANQVVGDAKIVRLLALARRAKLMVGVDSLEVAALISRACAAAGLRLRALLEVDVGFGRCGVSLDKVAALAAQMAKLPGLNLVGVYTYPGQVYQARNEAEVEGLAFEEARELREAAAKMRAFCDVESVSGGSTPTAAHYRPDCGLTEIRPGAYVYHDRTSVALWAARPAECALSVLATVISLRGDDRAILDAGVKALGREPAARTEGWAAVKGAPGAVVDRLSEEHGFLSLGGSDLRLKVGDRVELIPNHCCVVSNLFDEAVAVRGGEMVDVWPVAARGKMR
jgi:D-serine deaminase-like pyridoxal phosphate-dependent protein